MAKMLGRLGWYGQCACCNTNMDKSSLRLVEERQWRAELEMELSDEAVGLGVAEVGFLSVPAVSGLAEDFLAGRQEGGSLKMEA